LTWNHGLTKKVMSH